MLVKSKVSVEESSEESGVRRNTLSKKDPKKIAGIMGMGGPQIGPLIPTGMVLTKPSDVKKQEQLALSRYSE